MYISHRYFMKTLHTQRVMNTRPALEARKGVSAGIAFRQRLQPCFSLPGSAMSQSSTARKPEPCLTHWRQEIPSHRTAPGVQDECTPHPDACGFRAVTG